MVEAMEYDQYGVPRLSTEDIEAKAEHFLSFFDGCLVEHPKRVPIVEIMENLRSKYKVEFRFERALTAPDGVRVLGAIVLPRLYNMNDPPRGPILIDEAITNHDSLFNFTAAHEIGHLVLHCRRRLRFSGQESNEDKISDTGKDIFANEVRRNGKWVPRDWVEWQANRFASALLMPSRSMKSAVIEYQKEHGIRNPGRVFLDRQNVNFEDYHHLVKAMCLKYGVSREAVRIRLEHLRILVRVVAKNSRHFERAGTYPIERALTSPPN